MAISKNNITSLFHFYFRVMTDKGDGVFVDFSDVDEEVVEEEVVQSGATSANAVPGSQGPLPPVVYEYVEKFKESYSQYRKQYLVGLAVLGIVVLVASKYQEAQSNSGHLLIFFFSCCCFSIPWW